MEPHLRGLAILYAATSAWAILFAVCGLLAALALGVPRVVATIFAGPRLFGLPVGSCEFVVRAIPLPTSSVAIAPEAVAGEGTASDGPRDRDGRSWSEGELPPRPAGDPEAREVGEDPEDGESASLPPPFAALPFGLRAIVLLGPYVILAFLVAGLEGLPALGRLPRDLELLLRGAVAPLDLGADLAGGFLHRLGTASPTEALGAALRKQLAILLLPFWGGLWSTLLFVIRREPARSRFVARLATLTTLPFLLLVLAWIIAIIRALLA